MPLRHPSFTPPLAPSLTALLCLLTWGCSASTERSTLWDYRLGLDRAPDTEFQRKLEALDASICRELGIPPEKRAFGVLDLGYRLRDQPLERPGDQIRFAAVRPDALFYGASVPKIGILLGYFETHPSAASKLDSTTRRELEQMIKRSSNTLAAKYSQLVGLERLEQIYTAPRYALYEPEHGGLWSGKHYGYDAPRKGDPVGDHSHAVTVRQCLRYYLMLEQGALVSPRASAAMTEIFAAPSLEFHQDNFVAGLTGRDVTMIRKNGLWEDWRLDTARVAIPDATTGHERVLLLAGATHHPAGSEYLSRIAAGVHELTVGNVKPKRDIHLFVGLDPVGEVANGGHESRPVDADHPFNRVLLSFNADTPDDGGVAVDVRVGRSADASWSPYLEVGYWGQFPPERGPKEFAGGKVDVDVFRSEDRFDRVQYRVRTKGRVNVANVAITLSDTTGRPHSEYPPNRFDRSNRRTPVKRIDVPFRSQKSESPELASRICSPTSVAMVLEYHGSDAPTAKIASEIFDPDFDLYGNWPRAVQAAYARGVAGHLRAFSSFRGLYPLIRDGLPVVISIRADEGELTGAPYPKTAGHLLVVTGFDAEGNVHVNDPAAPDAARGRATYDRAELEHCWQRAGGVTYVFRPDGR